MESAVERYLDERRGLGFDLRIAGGILLQFARYADARGHRGPLTLELQVEWARTQGRRAEPTSCARRLEVLRPFARYYCQFEPHTSVPERTTFGPARRHRLMPHIYTDQEIRDLIAASGRLQPTGGLRPATYQTLFGVIAASGLRLSEGLQLRDADVDLRRHTLLVRQTKFKKSRLLPIHATTVEALGRYRRVRDHWLPGGPDTPFFVGSAGQALPRPTVHGIFARLRTQLGWVARGGHPRARLHDLRHTFAVRRVQRWQEEGLTIDHGVFWLSTYLGHASIADTYWYLTGTPELLAGVATCFERFAFGAAEVGHA
jgi:integrase